MRAFAVKSFGEAPAIHDLPIPAAEGSFLIRVKYAGVNPIDYKIRCGDMQEIMPLQLPFIPGYDLAGQVVALGEGVTSVKLDAMVMGVTEHTYSD